MLDESVGQEVRRLRLDLVLFVSQMIAESLNKWQWVAVVMLQIGGERVCGISRVIHLDFEQKINFKLSNHLRGHSS